eukprot:TRINITY_DN1785_c0_g1_i8.p1 TRINITY_DN1785_c0_g1~~TRINITY_DN1785_c0_g1_i8.p1  ORF type:complete len:140 (+),score=22.05 TRINITY_DN1785_c0_g1_i8:89-508(+)
MADIDLSHTTPVAEGFDTAFYIDDVVINKRHVGNIHINKLGLIRATEDDDGSDSELDVCYCLSYTRWWSPYLSQFISPFLSSFLRRFSLLSLSLSLSLSLCSVCLSVCHTFVQPESVFKHSHSISISYIGRNVSLVKST